MRKRFVFPLFAQLAFEVWPAAGFCEAQYGGMFKYGDGNRVNDFPEYGNSFSALAMCFIGVHMIVFWDSQSAIFPLLSALFFVNGLGSFMFHYTGASSWGSLDANSMTLAAMMMFGFVAQEFVKCAVHRQHGKTLDETDKANRLWMGFVWLLCLTFAFWVMCGAQVPFSDEPSLYKKIFEISFGLPIVLCVVMVNVAVIRGWVDHEYITKGQRRRALRHFFFGLAVASSGFISWVLNEKLCAKGTFFQVLPGHLFWHIAMPYGMMNMLILVVFFQAAAVKKRPKLKGKHTTSKFASWYFYFFPAPRFHEVEKLARKHMDKLENTLGNIEGSTRSGLQNTLGNKVDEVETEVGEVVAALFHHSGSACSLDGNDPKVEEIAENMITRMEGMLSDEKLENIHKRATMTADACMENMEHNKARLLRSIELLKSAEEYAHNTHNHIAKHVRPHVLAKVSAPGKYFTKRQKAGEASAGGDRPAVETAEI